ncbi:MAG: FapA family protein, partial [Pseudoalteromonas rhizosphaerae]
IHSEQDLFIERQALHCDLSARRLIRVGKANNPRGKIIGGNILDAMRIETGELGAPSGTKTRVFIAQYWHDLRQKQLQIADFEKLLATKSAALKQARKKAVKIPAPAKRQLFLDKISASEQQINIRIANTKRKKHLVKQKIAQLLATSRLKINELMHPGVELKIAKDSKHFSRIYPPHLVKMSEGKITQSF